MSALVAPLGFLLGTAAAVALVGAAVSAATVAAGPLVARLSAARRADAALAMLLVPGAAALTVGLSVAVPSLRQVVGLGADHCAEHLHHPHLCWLHATALPPSLALLGALALVLFAWRVVGPIGRTWRVERAARALGRVARTEGGVVRVIGEARVCHVVGVLSPRVYLSERLSDELAPAELAAVLDHERAHVERRDPAVGLLVSLLAAFGLPGVAGGWQRVWRQAAEEAADAEAAVRHGPIVVARALLSFERLRIRPRGEGIGFGEGGIEARVLHLLEGEPVARRSASLPLVAVAVALVGLATLARSDDLHHRVEDALHSMLDGAYYRG